MSALLPGRKRLTMRGAGRKIIHSRVASSIDTQLKVVCKTCNEGWMSNIEGVHAKPAMADLMLGKKNVQMNQLRANSIAIFMFKTALILDALAKDTSPFFSREIRHEFRKSHCIPANVRMWLNSFAPAGYGEANVFYNGADLPSGKRLELYVCTFAVQHFVLQLVAMATDDPSLRGVSRSDEFLAVPLWPSIPADFVWPTDPIATFDDLNAFSDGWARLNLS